jgi:hypothetical protein
MATGIPDARFAWRGGSYGDYGNLELLIRVFRVHSWLVYGLVLVRGQRRLGFLRRNQVNSLALPDHVQVIAVSREPLFKERARVFPIHMSLYAFDGQDLIKRYRLGPHFMVKNRWLPVNLM